MSHKFPLIEEPDSSIKVEKALNAVLERGPSRRFRKERERALSSTPKSTLLSLLISKDYAAKQTRQLLDVTLTQLEDSTRRLALAEASGTPQSRYNSEVSPQLSTKVVQSIYDAQEAASRAQSDVNLYKIQLEEAQREIHRAQDAMRVMQRQRDEAERKAAEAREIARQIREEQLLILAREEGRKYGFEDGFEHGRQVARARKEKRIAIEDERRKSRTKQRVIEDVKPDTAAQATPASEAPLPVPPPRPPTVVNERDEPPTSHPPTPEPQYVPQVMNMEPPPRHQPSFESERPQSIASRSSQRSDSLHHEPPPQPPQEQTPDVFLTRSPGQGAAQMVSFPSQPSVTSSQLGPEVTPTPAPPSVVVPPMPEAIVMPQPMTGERPRSTSSGGSVPPPGMISSYTPNGRPRSVASSSTIAPPAPPGQISSSYVPNSRPTSVVSTTAANAPLPYLRMPEPPPSLVRSSSRSSGSRTSSLHSFGAAPPPPPMVAADTVPRQPSRSSSRQSSVRSGSYGAAPPPPPMVQAEPVILQSSRSSSRQSSYRPSSYGVAPPMQVGAIPRIRTSSLSSSGSASRPHSRQTPISESGRRSRSRSPEPPTPSSTATGFSQLELMNFPNPAAEYMNSGSSSRRERKDSLRDRDRDRYITQLTAIPEHLTGSSRASQSPNHYTMPSPRSTVDHSLQPPPFSAESWSSITTVPTPSSIHSSWGPPPENSQWGSMLVHNQGPSMGIPPSQRTTPEIVVTPDRESIRYVPPPLHLEHDNFLGPSSARRTRDGLYLSANDSSSTQDSRRYSTESSSTVGITVEPPSRPSSVTGQSRPPSASGHGLLSPNHAHMNLPTQPAPVIPSAEETKGLPPGFVAVSFSSPAAGAAPSNPYGAPLMGPSGSGRPYSPYAPTTQTSTEPPVIPRDLSAAGGPKGRTSQLRSEASTSSPSGAQRYAVAPTPPGFSYPAPLGATPGAGSYLRSLPKRGDDDDDSQSTSETTADSDEEVASRIIPPRNSRNARGGRRVAFS